MSSMPESESAFSFKRTNRLRGMLILGVFLFHFCNFFPAEVKPDIGHTFVGAFFLLSGFGLLESFKRKENYLDEFVGKKTARLLVPVWIAGMIVLMAKWIVFDNHSILGEHTYLFDIISGGTTTTVSWFVVELIFFYLFFYLAFKHLSVRWAIVAVSAAVALLMILLSQQDGMWYGSGMMFPAGLVLSYFRGKIESVKPHTILIVSVTISLIFAYYMKMFRLPWYSGLIYGNLQCLLVSLLVILSLLGRKTGVGKWLVSLLLCNIVYYALETSLQLGPNIITVMPVMTIFLVLAGMDTIAPLTNLFGNVSYEFYLIHAMMIFVSMTWFSDMLLCFISSLVLSLIIAIAINRVSKIFFDNKKKGGPQSD